MKVLALAACLASVALAADVTTTVTCPDCAAPSSTNDVVTRSPIPSTSCDSPALTTIKVGSQSGVVTSVSGSAKPTQTGGSGSNPTTVPVAGSAGRVAGNGAVIAIAVAVALM